MTRKGKGKDESQDWKHKQMPAEEKKSKGNMIRVTCFDGNSFSGKDIRGEIKIKFKVQECIKDEARG